MSLSGVIAGTVHDPFHEANLRRYASSTPGAHRRPSWQLTRWPVMRDEFEKLVDEASRPDETDAVVALDALGTLVTDIPSGGGLAVSRFAGLADQTVVPVVPTAPPTVVSNLAGLGRTPIDPPDPALAVGPDDVMIAVNDRFAVISKSAPGAPTALPLAALFGPAVPPNAFLFDPKLAYDHYAQRWIVLSDARRQAPAGSWLVIATSQTSDPRGRYNTWTLDASYDGQNATNNWADFPGLGYDEQAVYIAVNMMAFGGGFQHAKLRILNKAELYPATGRPAPALHWFDIGHLSNPDGSRAFGVQPATHFRGRGGPAYLVNALWPRGDSLTVWTLTDPLAPWLERGGTPSLSNRALPCNGYAQPPSAKQPGAPPLVGTDDVRLSAATYDADGPAAGLWTAHTSKFTWPGESEARSLVQWYQIDPTGPAMLQQGRYGEPGAYHYFPALATAANGDAFLVFGRSGMDDYAHLRATGRAGGDPAGRLRDSATIQSGSATYMSPGSGTTARWGDYFSATRDPHDPGLVWLYGQYASPGGAWATRVCSVRF
ncbi:MAG: hypothetical protein QOI11_1645 [Candidatus Eremiobacteraeota bacterium]|jgi:hypothetical protein|nr:hypothetical protein [Candidatus Eremiobacteraeota bacterium]